MSAQFWEVFGETRKAILDLDEKTKEAKATMLAFAKRHGTTKFGISGSFTVCFALQFKTPPDPKLWKQVKNSDGFYIPRHASKEGKALVQEMYEIECSCPSGLDVNKVIGFDSWIIDNSWYSAGYAINGRRVIVKTPDVYKPPKKQAHEIKRIADTLAEKLINPPKKKKAHA